MVCGDGMISHGMVSLRMMMVAQYQFIRAQSGSTHVSTLTHVTSQPPPPLLKIEIYISFQLITKISRHQIQQCSMADFGACPLYKNNFGRQDENLTHLTLFPTLYLLVLLRIWYFHHQTRRWDRNSPHLLLPKLVRDTTVRCFGC